MGRYRAIRAGVIILMSSALSSGTNVLASVSGAALLQPDQYGAFSLIFIVTIFAAALLNSLTGEVFISKSHSSGLEDRTFDLIRAAGQVCLWLFLLALAGAALLQYVFHSWLASTMLAVGVTIPAVGLRAMFRSVFYALGRARVVLWMDLLWFCWVFVAMTLVWIVNPILQGFEFGILWAAGAYLPVVPALVRSRRGIVGASGLRWLREEKKMARSLSYGVVVDSGSRHVISLALGGVGGLAFFGGLRLMQTLFGVCTVVFSAGRVFSLTRFDPGLDAKRYFRRMVAMSLVLGCVPLLLFIGLSAFEPYIRMVVVEATWEIADLVMLPVALSLVGVGLTQGALVGLRKFQRPGLVARAQTITGILVIGTALLGLLLFGTAGGIWGLAIGPIASSFAFWYFFVSCFRSES